MVTAAVLGHFLRIGKLPKIPYSASPHAALQAARALLLEEVGGASIGARIYLYPYLLALSIHLSLWFSISASTDILVINRKRCHGGMGATAVAKTPSSAIPKKLPDSLGKTRAAHAV